MPTAHEYNSHELHTAGIDFVARHLNFTIPYLRLVGFA